MRESSSDPNFNRLNSDIVEIKTYRIVMFSKYEELVYTSKFASNSDKNAITIAENMYSGLELDLWEGSRHIINIPASKGT